MKDKCEIDQIFELLDEWRLLPAYQLERRADIFFAIYLKEIIESHCGYSIKHIIPEFPIHIGTLHSEIPKFPDSVGTKLNTKRNQSFKMDYLVECEEKVLFIELKTDISSKRDKQDDYLAAAKEVKIPKLIDGLIAISQVSTSKIKYARLMKKVSDMGWLKIKKKEESWENLSKDKEIEIIYIQPSPKKPKEVKDKCDEVKCIYFKTIAKLLEKKDSELAKRFAESLEKWETSPNENNPTDKNLNSFQFSTSNKKA